MIAPHWIDFAAVALLAILSPLNSAFRTVPKMLSFDTSTQDKLRPNVYASVLIGQWLLAAAALRPYIMGELSLSDLGLSIPTGNGLLFTITGMVVVTAALAYQHLGVRRASNGAEEVRRSIQKIRWLIPRTRKQKVAWITISVHAGVCEELFYRAFMVLLLSNWMPLWAACVVMTLLFGLGHVYQGMRGVVGTAILGGVFLGMYLLTGSLWLSILSHALYDVSMGFLASWALRHERLAITT
ncbi:CPBP family intramembrane metalloprotease [Planctomycetota bacterium]|nr:CPBP family intramembrane metalloprotease [Planctomycetota bacterium]